MKDKRKLQLTLLITIISSVLIVGAILLVALISYMVAEGNGGAFGELIERIKDNGVTVSLILALMILLPIALISVLVLSSIRRRKYKKLTKTWEDAVKAVAEREAEQAAAQKRAEEEEQKLCRFGSLNSLDRKNFTYMGEENSDITLKGICEQFRLFAASKLGLYYDISDIRQFIAGLAVSHILILQGMSGTGKTSLAYAFGEFINNPSTVIPVQPMWKERTDLLGYYNEFTKKFNETVLLQKLYEANYRDDMCIAILDEMNIARVEYYFAEFLSLLEIPDAEARYLEVVSDKWESDPALLKDGRIKLPENMWFIGTVNNDDSTFAISDKVYDRAMVLNLDKKADVFDADGGAPIRLTFKTFSELSDKASEEYEITFRNQKRLKVLDDYLIDKFQITFGNRIMKQIKSYLGVYVSCGGDELDALDDILTKKVLRKLESQNAAYVKREAEALCGVISNIFGENKMLKCKNYIRRLARTI